MLLQIMEEGHLSDAKGHKVDFRNAIIVMTSNIGADVIRRQSSLGFQLSRDEDSLESSEYEEMKKKLLESLKKVFRPEFMNRLDSVVVFRMLNKEDIRKIVTIELAKISDRLVDHEIKLVATEAAVDRFAEEGFDPEMGARPLRRVLQQKVEDRLSDALLAHEFEDGQNILIDIDEDGQIILRPQQEEPEQPVEINL
jgi:ATP-dependent Clp protease ATP-binding subunit ClpC